VGRGPAWGQGQGMPQKKPSPRPLSGAGRGKAPGADVFRGPTRPITNSTYNGGIKIKESSGKLRVCLHHFYSIWPLYAQYADPSI